MTDKKNIIAVVQARMTSKRLPGKVLSDLAGKPMLVRVVERIRQSDLIDSIVVATTHEASDNPIEDLCSQQGYDCYRGNPQDVLDRFYQVARQIKADVVVRITADCPVIDPELVDETILAFLGGNSADDEVDFAANRLPPPYKRTYPIGLDTEVCLFRGLEKAWQEADQPYHREHVMPYFYEGLESISKQEKKNRLGSWELYRSQRGFKVLLLQYAQDFGSYRWTVDTPADLALLQHIYDHFVDHEDFTWTEVLEFMNMNPDLLQLNKDTHHKDFHESEISS